MILNTVFFILAALLLIKVLLKDNFSTLLLLLAATISAFSVVRTDCDKELFFWYTGALTYTLELSLAFIALAFCILLMNTTDPVKRRICLVISMLSGFIASGGSLEVTAPNCAWLLLMLILCRQEVKKQKILIWPFIISFAGALINVLAPGNFVRAKDASKAGHITLADAIRDTFTCYHDETAAIFGSVFFVAVLAVVFIVCILCRTKIFRNGISNARILLLVPAVFLIQYFTMFPVVFGYHSTSLISLRTTGTYEIVARFMYLFYTFCLAQWCSEHLKTKVTAAVPMVTAAVIAIIVFAASGSKGQDFTNGFTGEILSDYCSGSMKTAYETRVFVMTSLWNAEDGTDVVMTVPLRMDFKSMYGMGLTDDTNSMCNKSAAGLFHLNSVSINYVDPE
jgi:voltage-gated potassium channel Kch